LPPRAGEEPVQGRGQFGGIGADQLIGADAHRLRPFGGIAQGQAGYAQDRGFLGDTARVGDDGLGGARMMGAIFMKFGRAPAMMSMSMRG